MAATATSAVVASPWERRVDSTLGKVFYYNTETNKLSWNAPLFIQTAPIHAA